MARDIITSKDHAIVLLPVFTFAVAIIRSEQGAPKNEQRRSINYTSVNISYGLNDY